MFLIGLTGGIASGKSTVGDLLSSLGAEVIDADEVARDVVQPGTEGLKAVVGVFGPEILNADGTLSRAKLAEIVFASPEKRLKLESILHPLIKTRTQELFSSSQKEVVVYQVPLLVEANVDHPFDLVVTVEAGTKEQVARMMESRSMSEEDALARISAQASEAQRVARADVRIDSSGSLENLREQVKKLWTQVQERIAARGANGAH